MTKKGYWKTRQGKVLKIKDMSNYHIYNCICFLIGHIVCDPVYNDCYRVMDMVRRVKALNKKKVEFEKEYRRRVKK